MITITGPVRLKKGGKVYYTSPVNDLLPVMSPNFTAMVVDFRLYMPRVDANGDEVLDEQGNVILNHETMKQYRFTEEDLASEDADIADILDKLQKAVEKKIMKDLKSYNPGTTEIVVT